MANDMNWYEITITTNKDDVDTVSEILLDQGCGGVSIDDPEEVRDRLDNPLPLDYVGEDLVEKIPDSYAVKAYFCIDSDIDKIAGEVCRRIKESCQKQNDIFVKLVDDEHWNSWKEYFKPFELIDGITVVPSWEEYHPKPGEKIIMMDPGMAFGTGTHETTRLCADLIYRYVSEGDAFLDLGTGTGILSMLAHFKNADKITAVDIDDAAVRAAKENFEINGIQVQDKRGQSDGIEVVKGTLDSVKDRKFNVIAANILAEVLIGIASDMAMVVEAPGIVILSGIIQRKEQDVKDAYNNNGFELLKKKYENDWVAMVFQWRDFI